MAISRDLPSAVPAAPTATQPSPSAKANVAVPAPEGDVFSADRIPSAPREAPFPARISGYTHPIDATELPDPDGGMGVLSLNLANGAGDRYRTAANRAAQATLLREAGATVVGFQEVDTGVARSGDVPTALEIARQVSPSLAAFGPGMTPVVVELHAPSPETAIRKGADGTTLYQTPEATLITGESFSGDDRGGGVSGDRGDDATYGNALYVAAPNRVTEAYTVVLPHSATSDTPPVTGELSALASGKLTSDERAALGAVNETARKGARSEPRTALVARIAGPDGKERTVINVHLAAGRENEALRGKQLAYLAELVKAERQGPPEREIVLMGDFNDSTGDVGRVLAPIGMRREVGGKKEGIRNIDQIWVSSAVQADTSAQVKTNGVSDHPHAAFTVVR